MLLCVEWREKNGNVFLKKITYTNEKVKNSNCISFFSLSLSRSLDRCRRCCCCYCQRVDCKQLQTTDQSGRERRRTKRKEVSTATARSSRFFFYNIELQLRNKISSFLFRLYDHHCPLMNDKRYSPPRHCYRATSIDCIISSFVPVILIDHLSLVYLDHIDDNESFFIEIFQWNQARVWKNFIGCSNESLSNATPSSNDVLLH